MEEHARLLRSLRGGLQALALPSSFSPAAFPREILVETVTHILRRLHEGPAAPVRIAFFGPTGVGKSKLFNSLAGANLSPSGYRRPFTMRPVYLIDRAHEDIRAALPGDVAFWPAGGLRGAILIDTPDFDSVERGNRKEAERIFREADGIIFITDVQKYADHSTWEYLDRVFERRKTAAVILNKVSGDGPAADFFARLEARFGKDIEGVDLAVLGERPVDDEGLLPSDEEGLETLRARIGALSAPGARGEMLLSRLRADIEGFFDAWDGSAATLRRCLDGIRALSERLDGRFAAASHDIEMRLHAGVDPSLKAEVYSRVLERIQRLDVLRYPRKLLWLPVEGLRSLVKRWFPPREAPAAGDAGEDPARTETFQLLDAALLRLCEETWDDLRSEKRCPDLVVGRDLHAFRIPHDEFTRLYGEREAAFADWLRREATETASTLTGENKAKFILSQLIYNSVVVGIQIHTAGGFTLAELLADGVLSPIVAKAVGIAVSSERVAEFERRAQAEHHRLLVEVLDRARGRFAAHLESQSAWREAFEALAKDVESFRSRREGIVAAFVAGGRHGPP
jgi:energy-coupling factor transporter ATP-binding protein EcfA2